MPTGDDLTLISAALSLVSNNMLNVVNTAMLAWLTRELLAMKGQIQYIKGVLSASME